MPNAGGLQLLPETRKKIEIKIPGQNRLVAIAAIFILLVFVLYIGAVFLKNSVSGSIKEVEDQTLEIEKARDKESEIRLLNLNSQLNTVQPLLSSHVIWSDALVRIQQLAQPKIRFKSFNADLSSKRFVFEAIAADYTTVARQIAAFYTDDSITDLSLNKVTALPSGEVGFFMQLDFDVNKFLISIK